MEDQVIHTVPPPNWSCRTAISVMVALTVATLLALWIDIQFTEFSVSGVLPGDVSKIIEMSEIFAHGFGGLLVMILVWRLVPDLRHRLAPLAGCIFLPGLAVLGLKMLVSRNRPLAYPQEFPATSAETWTGWLPGWQQATEYTLKSFPSAHAATAFAMAIALGWLFPRGRFLFLGLATLASFQRISSGAHWLSDVIAGVAVAVAVCFLVFRYHRMRDAQILNRQTADTNQRSSCAAEIESDRRAA